MTVDLAHGYIRELITRRWRWSVLDYEPMTQDDLWFRTDPE